MGHQTKPAHNNVAMSEDRQKRWATCCHEAGHVLAAYVILRDSSAACAIATDGRSGVTTWTQDLGTGFDRALVVAAGPAAQELAQSIPCPDSLEVEHEPPPEADHVSLVPARAASFSASSPCRMRDLIPDSRALALWAITGYESDPERWGPRINRIHREADLFVRRHQRSIVALAEKLFVRGSVAASDVLPPLPPDQPTPIPEDQP